MMSAAPKRKLFLERLETRIVLSATHPFEGFDFDAPGESKHPTRSALMSSGHEAEDHRGRQRDVRVMTQNVYLGGDVGPAVGALFSGDQDTIVAAMGELWSSVEATDFHERAAALADQIERVRPDLIGLQEVFVWRTGTAFDPAPATHVEFDFRQILSDELAERGLEYEIVADTTSTDAEFPGETAPGLVEDIRLTDHDLILARSDVPRGHLKLRNVQEANFQAVLPLPIPNGPLVIERGWNSVDVQLRGQRFRLINTHLESFHPGVQVAQANELLDGPAATTMPVILLGDFNSSADPDDPDNQTDTYDNLVAAGFEDAWSQVHPGDPGHTCCQDADLLNPTSLLDSRIDLVLFRDGDRERVRAVDAVLLGGQAEDRTASGWWPSDHASVAATLEIHRQPPARRAAPFDLLLRHDRPPAAGDAERLAPPRVASPETLHVHATDAWFAQQAVREIESKDKGRARRSHPLEDDLLHAMNADLSWNGE